MPATTIPGKGTKLQVELASVLTDVPGLVSIDIGEQEPETFESDSLDNTDAGIPYTATGRVEGNEVSFEGWLNPVAAGLQMLTDMINTPTLASTGDGGNIKFADAGLTSWPFQIASVRIGASVALNEGVRFSGAIKLNGKITFP
jgi:hypothetical protein